MIFAISLSFVLVKSIIKALMFSLLIISLIIGVGAFFVVKDAIDLKNNFMDHEKLMVLKDGDTVYAAFTFKNISLDKGETLNSLGSDNISQLEESIKRNDYSNYKASYYKIIIFNYSAFNNSLSEGLKIDVGTEEIIFSEDEVKKIFNSNNPSDILYSKFSEKKIFDNFPLTSQEQLKNYLFAYMALNMVKNDGILKIIPKIKSGEINVQPNTAIFKGIKLLPLSLISKLTDKIQKKMESNI